MMETAARHVDAKTKVWRMVTEGYTDGRAEIADEICHPRFVNNASVMAVPEGPTGLAAHIQNAHAGIPDIRLWIVDLVADGDDVAVLWATQGKASGYFAAGTGQRA